MKKTLVTFLLFFAFTSINAQQNDDSSPQGLQYKIEMQTSISASKTPLWLNANKYGLSSLDKKNGYIRASLVRPLPPDTGSKWSIGYGADLVVPYNYTSTFVIQQAFVETRWLHGVLSVGSKEYPMELKNNELSSGSQTLGINSRPVPQVRIALPDYWTLPFGKGWLHIKGHIAYGKMTDDNWQHDFTKQKNKYSDDVLYHSKAGYLKIGNDDSFCPFSLELGLEMATLFGGTSYSFDNAGNKIAIKGGTNLKDFWNAFFPGGSDAIETSYKNVEGDQLGSWLLRLNYINDNWGISFYADKFFEDHSAMFQTDYDGYGQGTTWNSHEKHKYFVYDFKDCMLGTELFFPNGTWLKNIVFEYLYTKYQSGPIYHDHSPEISDHLGGNDNFYNHNIYPGWQHWGQVMGNPLYRSPIYNEDGNILVENNRFVAFHLGFNGRPTEQLYYRILATYQESFGTYNMPYTKSYRNFCFLTEANYSFTGRLKGWNMSGAYAMDFGKTYGNNQGFQLTISKTGIFNLKHPRK